MLLYHIPEKQCDQKVPNLTNIKDIDTELVSNDAACRNEANTSCIKDF